MSEKEKQRLAALQREQEEEQYQNELALAKEESLRASGKVDDRRLIIDPKNRAASAAASSGGFQFGSMAAMGATAAHSRAASTIGDFESKDLATNDEFKGTAALAAAADHNTDILDITSGAQATSSVAAVVGTSRRSSTSSAACALALNALFAEAARQDEKRATVATDIASLTKLGQLDKAIGLLFIYNDSGSTVDSFRVNVDKSTDALVAGILDFLQMNVAVLQPWIRVASGSCSLPESTLLVLHILLHLHTLQDAGKIFERINVSVLSSSALEQSLGEDDVMMTIPDDAILTRWKALKFPGVYDGFIHFRYCGSLAEVAQGVPLRVVYIDSLIWLQQIGDLATIKERMKSVLEGLAAHHAPPVILPQPEWEELVEDKPTVYEKLKEYMLPTLWVHLSKDEIKVIRAQEAKPAADGAAAASSIAAASSATSSTSPPFRTIEQMYEHYKTHASEDAKNTVLEFCKRLLAGCKEDLSETHKKQKYYIKGGFSDCGVCSSSFTFAPSDEDPDGYGQLPELIYIWTRNSGQTSFGRQKQVKKFKKREYRFWFTSGCTPTSPATLSWRYACMLQSGVTSVGNNPAITVEQSCCLTPEANACYDLAHELIKTDYIRSFLNGDNPMPALRLDCGWNSATEKAFLNEMGVSPGAWIFSECHKLDILNHVAKSLVGFMKPHLQEKPAAHSSVAINAASAAK